MTLRVTELTARGRGGISVLAVEGPGALQALAVLAGRSELPLGVPVVARLRAEGEILDEAICLAWDDERAEVHVHGSPAVVERVRAALTPAAASAAAGSPGDAAGSSPACTIEERARELLGHASSEAAARVLLDQARGALRSELERLALVDPARWRAGLAELGQRARALAPLFAPVRVVLAGPANAGKSTLFNALLGSERAVVDPTPGTTRDAVEEAALLGRWPAVLVDTAGAVEPARGEASSALERAAGQRAREAIRGADVVLWCQPDPRRAVEGLELAPRAALVRLTTRADELAAEELRVAPEPIRALTDPAHARERVAARLREALDLPESPASAFSSGRGVPFEPGMAAELAALSEVTSCDRRWTALRACTGGPRSGVR